MINHLEWHQHAFLDKNNVVINVSVFDEWAHNHQLLEDIKIANEANKIICCCQYGIAGIGDTWDDSSESWIFKAVLDPFGIDEEFQV
jgi:hypothetical protein